MKLTDDELEWLQASQDLLDCHKRPCKAEAAEMVRLYGELSGALRASPDSPKRRALERKLDGVFLRSGLARCVAAHCAPLAIKKANADLRMAARTCAAEPGSRRCRTVLPAMRAAKPGPSEEQVNGALVRSARFFFRG